eukprot:725946-Amphidinium_carterae.2
MDAVMDETTGYFVRKTFEDETCASMCEHVRKLSFGTGKSDCSQSQTTGHAQAMPVSVTRETEENQEEGSDLLEESLDRLVDEEEFPERGFEMPPEPTYEVTQDFGAPLLQHTTLATSFRPKMGWSP